MNRLGRGVLHFCAFALLVSGHNCAAQEPATDTAPLLTLEDAVRFAQENNRTHQERDSGGVDCGRPNGGSADVPVPFARMYTRWARSC